ncbi:MULTISPECIES: ribosome recycling factor [unclassified Nodosilinea]|uniref:Ribosome-recycling factor n=1 Tax=Leptolyngbya subtilissima DQ-A4 TaxID=2933933 RepID=A0ABV0K7J5_9CYAN|nr:MULTISPECIES: ribosome recycling factor [unclassified Nodosilinea]MBD2107944.1 ribosome recycling factor [Nodosilinea sp. FACHB-13]MBD2114809.1 ribosome recycling factor [Nodosilinea sp. FACHB-141]
MSVDDILLETEDQMQKSIRATQNNFNTIRTGRANASLLDRIEIDYYGAQTPLKQMANISIPDSTTLMIQPYDASSLTTIEKAISLSDVGLTPNNDGRVIRLNIPPLTSERRKEFVKTAGKVAEEGRVSIRNQRRNGIDAIKKLEKASDISEDESRDAQDEIQKLTDKYIAQLDEALAAKEKDIMTV